MTALFLASTVMAQQVPWAVPNAPIRAVGIPGKLPSNPDAGFVIGVPDFGSVKQGGGYNLMDASGASLPVAVVWQGQAQNTLLLARGLQSGQTYYLYIGGTAGPSWTPKTSVLFETRRSPAGRGVDYTSSSALEAAWNSSASQAQGARFVDQIYSGDNPFGDPALFFSHFSAWLAPTSGDMELFTNSADSSFILINNQPFIDWTGRPSANAYDKGLHARKLPASAEPVKVDYYQEKGTGDDPPNMTMGWRKPGGHLELVPASAFLHAGDTTVERYESRQGTPVPAPIVDFVSYVGFGGAYLYRIQCKLGPADLQGADVKWQFDDGAVLDGRNVTRVMSGVPGTQYVTVASSRGGASMQTVRRIGFYGQPPPEAADDAEQGRHARSAHAHYIEMLLQLDPTRLDAAMLAAGLPLLLESATDTQAATFANAWLALKPSVTDPLWLPAFSASVHALAESDPRAAVAQVASNTQAHQLHGKALDLLELDLLVFSLHDPASLPRVQQLAFSLGPEMGKLGEIRVGDLYRLSGDTDRAIAHYQAAQPGDDSGARKLPAQDEANAMTVEDLLDNGTRNEAAERLGAWEIAHPMAKFTSNFPLLRSRLLAKYGRWREALGELDAFNASHPDSPYEIDVNYYRARALYELGKKDDARKLWRDIAAKYPKSDFAKLSAQWADKP